MVDLHRRVRVQVQLRRRLLGQPQPAEVVVERPVRVDARLDADLRRPVVDRVLQAPDELLAVVLVGVGRALADPEPAERAADHADVGDVDVAVDDEGDLVAGQLGAQRVGGLADVLDRLRTGLGEQAGQLVGRQRLAGVGARDDAGQVAVERRNRAARLEGGIDAVEDLEHPRRLPLGVHVLRVDAQALGQRDAVLGQPLAHLARRREGMLGGDVVAVGAQPAEVGRTGGDQLRPPLGQVGRDLDADARQQPPRLADQALEVVERDRVRPLGQTLVRPFCNARPPELGGCVLRDVRRLLAVVGLVRDEVLEDDLLDVVEARQRLQRGDLLVLGLADADEDPAT